MACSSLRKAWSQSVRAKNNIADISVEDHLRATGQDHLPQATVLKGALKHLEKQGLVEAYLRGSFSCGEADEYSDIDLFLVVRPEQLESTYESFVSHLGGKYPVLVSCHDKLVKDYGGIGFMFVCKDGGDRLFQFDLYMAMKGVPPKALLVNSPRVYSGNPDYCWLAEKRAKGALPKNARRFMEKHSGGNDAESLVKYYMTDLMVTLGIMQKHLTRGQIARALNDNNHAIGVCVEMLRVMSNEKSHHSALYAADRLLKDCSVSADPAVRRAAQVVGGELLSAIGEKKISVLFCCMKDLIRETQPDLYAATAPSFDEYERLVLKKGCGGGKASAPGGPR